MTVWGSMFHTKIESRFYRERPSATRPVMPLHISGRMQANLMHTTSSMVPGWVEGLWVVICLAYIVWKLL